MLIRAIALSLALLIGIGVIVPLGTDSAEAGAKKHRRYKKKREWRGVKKYSKRWWQLYRAQERRKKALAKRRRALRLRRMRLARARKLNQGRSSVVAKAAPKSKAAMLPSGEAAPKGWQAGESTPGEVRFSVDDGVGSASISVVGPARGETFDRGRTRFLAGVPTTSLRRDVINRMIRENGWVVNDYQKEIGGKRVYVVVAQSQSGSSVNSRLFYFTEVDGRIYSVATTSRTEAAERLAEESEKVIYSLQNRGRNERAAARE